MKFGTRLIAFGCGISLAAMASAQPLRETALRERALEMGLVATDQLAPSTNPSVVEAGRALFQSEELSLSRQISCQSCHLDDFGSADGLPVAIGVGGIGEGMNRVLSQGDVLPRNTLPLWGRGAPGFDILFWDGKVDASGDSIVSQFGIYAPSQDPLVLAALLPLVQLGEMVGDDQSFAHLITESVDSANQVYEELVGRIVQDEELIGLLTGAYEVAAEEISIDHIVNSLADFIRSEFRLRPTRFHAFVFNEGYLTEQEIAGGLIFYGKGRCSACHNGPFFSDLGFHAIPFGQLGFGANGFGIDYGRYNVTLDPLDLYKFRTPPLFNVAETAPYSHSGSTYELSDAILAHVDPLALVDPTAMSMNDRVEFYRRLSIWADEPVSSVVLSEDEVAALEAFLRTLSF